MWVEIYRAQFLEYDLNFGQLLWVFLLSMILMALGIFLWIRRALIVRNNKAVTLMFLILNSPLSIVVVVLNYEKVFGVALKVG